MQSEKQQQNNIIPTDPEDHVLIDHHDSSHSRTVLLAVEHSEHSVYALDWVKRNFLNKSTDLIVLVNVRTFPSLYNYGSPHGDFLTAAYSLDEEARKASHALLQKFGGELKADGYFVRAVAIRGDPRSEIVRKSSELKADTVIVSSRGLGAIKRTFLGSTSDYVCHHCSCPVLVVKHPSEEGTATAAPGTQRVTSNN